MPDLDLVRRFGAFQLSSLPQRMDDEVLYALHAAVADARTWADLTDEQRATIRSGQLDVSAGNSPSLTNPAEWGDWTAIDNALASGDLDALDEALATVGDDTGYGEPSPAQPAGEGSEL